MTAWFNGAHPGGMQAQVCGADDGDGAVYDAFVAASASHPTWVQTVDGAGVPLMFAGNPAVVFKGPYQGTSHTSASCDLCGGGRVLFSDP